MSTSHTKSAFRRGCEEGFNQGNLVVVDEINTPDHSTHTPFTPDRNGNEALKEVITMFRTAFPDLHLRVEEEMTQGDHYAAHWTMRGTHQGPFLGAPATGKQVTIQGLIFARCVNGHIAEDCTLVDQLGLQQQLGLVPPPLAHVLR
jgi:steroid delta-isomerase-like uncharacterized protein